MIDNLLVVNGVQEESEGRTGSIMVGDVFMAVNHMDAFKSAPETLISELQRNRRGEGTRFEHSLLPRLKVNKGHVEDEFINISLARPLPPLHR